MRFTHLADWLDWQQSLHSQEIDLGLERVGEVWRRLKRSMSDEQPTVITVAGTNGKGSTIALFDHILRKAGLRVGRYTTPHFVHYRERIQIQGQPVRDERIVDAFERIDQARRRPGLAEQSLSFFEFGTLAALDLFQHEELDVWLLEVGLGGRLDAVNIIDADLAVITAIDLDHQDWLGDDLQQIAREKAGIMRSGKPVVWADLTAPVALQEQADRLGAKAYAGGTAFHWQAVDGGWNWRSAGRQWDGLPPPGLSGGFQMQNAAAVLMALALLEEEGRWHIPEQAIRAGLSQAREPGRFQAWPRKQDGRTCPVYLDVAHNPHAARGLKDILARNPVQGRNLAVFSILQDKDMAGVVRVLSGSFKRWYIAPVNAPRGRSIEELVMGLAQAGIGNGKASQDDALVRTCDNVPHALEAACQDAQTGDRVIVFGSFLTVEQIMRCAVQS